MRRYLLPAALLSLSALLYAEEEARPKIELSKFEVTRVRKDVMASNRVSVTFKVANLTEEELRDLHVRLIFYEALGKELLKSPPAAKLLVKPREVFPLTVSATFVPAFGAYELVVDYLYKSRRESFTWLSPDPYTDPELKTDQLLPNQVKLVILGHEGTQDPATGIITITYRVKNYGEMTAEGAEAVIQFFGPGRKLLGEGKVPMGKEATVKGGEEKTLTIRARAPNYDGYSLRVRARELPPEQALSGGKFTSAPEVEVGEISFQRQAANSLQISGKVRNGKKVEVSDVKVTFAFTGKVREKKRNKLGEIEEEVEKELFRVTHALPGKLSPQAIQGFSLNAACPAFTSYLTELDYREGAAAPGLPQNSKPLEVLQVNEIKLEPRPDKTLKLSAKVTNRGTNPVEAVRITFTLLEQRKVREGAAERSEDIEVKKCEAALEGRLNPNEELPLTAVLADCPSFTSYVYEAAFNEIVPRPAPKPKPAGPPTEGEAPK